MHARRTTVVRCGSRFRTLITSSWINAPVARLPHLTNSSRDDKTSTCARFSAAGPYTFSDIPIFVGQGSRGDVPGRDPMHVRSAQFFLTHLPDHWNDRERHPPLGSGPLADERSPPLTLPLLEADGHPTPIRGP